MRAKRWGRAGHGREQPRRRVIFSLAVLAGLLVCLVLPVRAQKKKGEALFPAGHHSTVFRTDTAGGRILLPGKGRSIRALILPVQREQKCLLRKAVRWCRHTAAQAMAPVCVFFIQMAASHFTPICSTPMSARARWWKQGSCWAQQGRSGRATGAHLHFELYRQGTACDPADALGLSS